MTMFTWAKKKNKIGISGNSSVCWLDKREIKWWSTPKFNTLVGIIYWLPVKSKRKMQLHQFLTVTVLKKSKVILIKRDQTEYFHKEIVTLENDNKVSCSSKIKSLYLYMQDGILLVKYRLQNLTQRDPKKYLIYCHLTIK